MERNRKWRERKEGREILEDEEKELDEKEKRKLKNREWRLKRERDSGDGGEERMEGEKEREVVRSPVLLAGLLAELSCASCSLSLCEGGGGRVWQCQQGHNICWQCSHHQPQLCPLCSQGCRSKSQEVGSRSLSR